MRIASRGTCWPSGPRRRRPSTRGSVTSCDAPTGSWIDAALGRIVFARPGRPARPGGDRPSGRAAAHPGGGGGCRCGRRRGGRHRGDQARRGRARRLCDEVWLVTCSPGVQLERLIGARQRPGRCPRTHRGPGRSGDAAATGRDPRHRRRGRSRRRPGRALSSGSKPPSPAPESSDRPGHARRPGRSGGAPGQRRGDGGSVREAARVMGSATSMASPSASGRGWRSASGPGSGAAPRRTDTRPGSAARSG